MMDEIALKHLPELPPIGDSFMQYGGNIVIGINSEAIRECYVSKNVIDHDRKLMIFTQGLGNEPKAFISKDENCIYLGFNGQFLRIELSSGNVTSRICGTVFYDVFFSPSNEELCIVFETEIVLANKNFSKITRESFDIIEAYEFDGETLSVKDVEGKCRNFRLSYNQ